MMANELAKDRFRDNVVGIQNALQTAIDSGKIPSTLDQMTLRHFFTPVNKKYGCGMYVREIFLPKGNLVIGKIHKHPTVNFVMTGSVWGGSPDGPRYIEAPSIFVSAPGMQRIGYIEADCRWATCHLTGDTGEENLDKIESELIAKDYHEFDLLRLEQE